MPSVISHALVQTDGHVLQSSDQVVPLSLQSGYVRGHIDIGMVCPVFLMVQLIQIYVSLIELPRNKSVIVPQVHKYPFFLS